MILTIFAIFRVIKKQKKDNSARKKGRLGENIASWYLSKKSFKIIKRNYYKWGGEIDIIALKNNVLHFIEVKTIIFESFSFDSDQEYKPEFNIGYFKISKIRETALSFLKDKLFLNLNFSLISFDVLAIRICQKKIKIKFLQNVF